MTLREEFPTLIKATKAYAVEIVECDGPILRGFDECGFEEFIYRDEIGNVSVGDKFVSHRELRQSSTGERITLIFWVKEQIACSSSATTST